MNVLFLMDPLTTVNIDKDTSFMFMLGAQRRGHRVFYVPNDGIHFTAAGLSFDATGVTAQRCHQQPFVCEAPGRLDADDVDAVFIRTDPPFDAGYLMNTWLLEHLSERVVVINRPSGVRTVNEKVWALRFDTLVPPSLVTADKERFLAFLAEHQHVVAKPTDGFGGQGVFIVKHGDSNAGVIFETLSSNGARVIIAQRYVPESTIGDKRILLLNGEPLGAVLRVHGAADHRNNFFAGGKPVACDITDRDLEIVETLRPHLQALGLMFVGIDVIGEYLIEVNVTSPTCLQEINNLYDKQLEEQVMTFVEEQVQVRTNNPELQTSCC